MEGWVENRDKTAERTQHLRPVPIYLFWRTSTLTAFACDDMLPLEGRKREVVLVIEVAVCVLSFWVA